jgi:hypothetical protein
MQTSSSGSLQMGSRGPSVSLLQSKLNTALVPSPRLVADGVFGMKTAQAVTFFQQRRGLTADGIVGPKTAAALGLSLGGMPGSTHGGHAIPVSSPPGGGPPVFVDLSMFNVVIEEIIGGVRKIELRLLSWIDSDFVPQFVFDRVEASLNNTLDSLASSLRGIARQAVPLGQDPAAFVTSRIREALARSVSGLFNALQPLVGLPVIGSVAARYQRILASIMSGADTALTNMRSNGQSAQEAARRIAVQLEAIARQIS